MKINFTVNIKIYYDMRIMGLEPTTSCLLGMRSNPTELYSLIVRTYLDLNQGPFDLQSSALPLSYKSVLIKLKTPPRFELGSKDSKSCVLTVTPWSQKKNLAEDSFDLSTFGLWAQHATTCAILLIGII